MKQPERVSKLLDSSSADPTVFIVDDDPDVCESLTAVLRSVDLGVESFSTAAQFLNAYKPERAGCVLVDVRLPGMTGLELQQHLLANDISIPVIFISAFNDLSAAIQSMRAGAVDFLRKPCSPHALLECVNRALKLDSDRRHRQDELGRLKERMAKLSGRELEIMRRLVEGSNAKQIASQFGISRKTVDNHRAHILEKMQVESVAQLIALALRDVPEH